MTSHGHLAVADVVTVGAAFAAAYGWMMNWLPGLVTVLVGIWAIAWYTIQMLDSPWWKKRRQSKHRNKMRRKRTWGV